MASVEIEDLHNLRCPTCGERLHAMAGKFEPLGRSEPVYVQEGARWCPNGHNLPADVVLYAWRDEHGYETPDL